jgi:LDH2 family malate/lactate/ureidoglycolate dehydrogenase
VTGRPSRTSHTFLAIDIARFMPVEEFTARMEKLVARIKSTPVAQGYDGVLVAGDPEWRTELCERRRSWASRPLIQSPKSCYDRG